MPEHFQSKHARHLIALALILPCLLICIPAIVAYRQQSQLSVAFRWVSHTIEVQRELQRLHALLVEAESNQGGFLLSASDSYIQLYESARAKILPQSRLLSELTADNPVQIENLRQLQPLLIARLDFMEQAVALEKQGRHNEALARLVTGQGQKMMESIRTRLTLMEDEESRLLRKRESFFVASSHSSTVFIFALATINVVFAGAMLVLLFRLSKARSLVTVCAWSKTVEYEGEWLSFEDYLYRRFNLDISHGMSPGEAQKAFQNLGTPRSEKAPADPNRGGNPIKL